MSVRLSRISLLLATAAGLSATGAHADPFSFTTGDLVLSVYGAGAAGNTTTYTDNQASPITLQQFTTTGIAAGQLVLTQVASGANAPISGEYGSSSEGTLQLSTDGQYLTIAGYGVNAATFNANMAGFGGAMKTCITSGSAAAACSPLAQTASVAGTANGSGGTGNATVVSRVIALVAANGIVNTTTALTGVFNENNPRSVTTANGSSFYISGQGTKGDTTQGVFTAALGATTATAISTSTDTRIATLYNGQLYVSTDSTQKVDSTGKSISGVTENIASYGASPKGTTTPAVLNNIASKFTVTSTGQLNNLGQASLAAGTQIYLSPEGYFFANATTLYVADSGAPKGDNNGTGKTPQGLSNGGLQKWTLIGGVWTLDYTLSAGLNLVPDTTACGSNQVGCGTTGLIGLTGSVFGDVVSLFATNSTLGDLDQTYLFGITDSLAATTLPTAESFTTLVTAAADTNIRGVSFAPTASAAVPVPEPATFAVVATALLGLGAVKRKRK